MNTTSISTALTTQIAEIYTDYFVDRYLLFNTLKVYYVNISNDPERDGYEYTKSKYYDIVTKNTTESNLDRLDFDTASVLPVGTKLCEDKWHSSIIHAEVNGDLIPYLKIVEG